MFQVCKFQPNFNFLLLENFAIPLNNNHSIKACRNIPTGNPEEIFLPALRKNGIKGNSADSSFRCVFTNRRKDFVK